MKLKKLWISKYKKLPNGVTNRSAYELNLEEKFYLSRGLKFGILPKKLDDIKLKAEIEKKVDILSSKTKRVCDLDARDEIKAQTWRFLNSAKKLCSSFQNKFTHKVLKNLSDNKQIKVFPQIKAYPQICEICG